MPSRFFRIGLLAVCAAFVRPLARVRHVSGQAEAASRAAPAESHPGTLLVFPFENDSRIANLDWLGEGLSELTVERLQDRGLSVLSRQERLAALEKIGLPDSARFSHATMVKIAGEADADEVDLWPVCLRRQDGDAGSARAALSPPSLSPPLTQTSSMQDLLRAHARLSWQILCALERTQLFAGGSEPGRIELFGPAAVAASRRAREFCSRPHRIRRRSASSARCAKRRVWSLPGTVPPFELGQIYFERRDCESALPWFSRVPPNRPDGPEASFDTGVCHLLRNDAARAEAAFSGLIERTRSADPKDRLPEFPEVHNNLGVARLRLGKWSEAATEFERAAALDPEEPDYWVNLGIAKLAGKQPAAAVAPLERARKLDPDDKDARALLISTLESLGRSSDAAAIRAESPESGGPRRSSPYLQDPAALARLARVSKKFDRVAAAARRRCS